MMIPFLRPFRSLCRVGAVIVFVGIATNENVLADIDLGIADDDVWVYVHAANPGSDPILRLWGNDGQDLNPTGYPGSPGTRDFYSYAFLQWELPQIPPGFTWRGARLTITIVEDTNYNPATDDVYMRGLTSSFDEDTWRFGVGPEPIPGPFIVGDDSSFAGAGSTITFDLPRNIPTQMLREWRDAQRIFLALTSPIDFDNDRKIVRFASGENLLYDGPRLVVFAPGNVPGAGSMASLLMAVGLMSARRRRR